MGKSCRESCGLFVAASEAHLQFSNRPALPDKGLQSKAETQGFKEEYFLLFASLLLILHGEKKLGDPPVQIIKSLHWN